MTVGTVRPDADGAGELRTDDASVSGSTSTPSSLPGPLIRCAMSVPAEPLAPFCGVSGSRCGDGVDGRWEQPSSPGPLGSTVAAESGRDGNGILSSLSRRDSSADTFLFGFGGDGDVENSGVGVTSCWSCGILNSGSGDGRPVGVRVVGGDSRAAIVGSDVAAAVAAPVGGGDAIGGHEMVPDFTSRASMNQH